MRGSSRLPANTASCAQLSSAGTRLRTPQIAFCDAQLWFAECPVKMKADYRASGELVLFAINCTLGRRAGELCTLR
jgi:hypothetical protein